MLLNIKPAKSAYQVSLYEIFVLLIATALVMPIVSIYLQSISREVFVQLYITWLVFSVSFAIRLYFNYRGRKKAEVQAGTLILAIPIRQRWVVHQIFGAFLMLYLSTSLTASVARLSSKAAFANPTVSPIWLAHVGAALLGECFAGSLHRSMLGGFERIEFRENGMLLGDFFTSWKHFHEIEQRTIANKTQLYFAIDARRIRFGIAGRVRYCRASHWKQDLPPNMYNEADRIVQSLNYAIMRSINPMN